MGMKRYAYGVWWENLKERNNEEDRSIGRCIILQRILNKQDARKETGFI
jgi:hypothetical protein